MNRLRSIASVVVLAAIFTACAKKEINKPVIVEQNNPAGSVSEGGVLTLNGLVGSEPGGAARNTVFVDLSADKQTSVLRTSWDLGFYGGSDFKVIINNTTSAGAKVMAASNLEDLKAEDIKGLELKPRNIPERFEYYDDVTGSFTKTAIPPIADNAADNKVIVLDPVTDLGLLMDMPKRDWVKFKITKNTSGGYTVQYGSIEQTSDFKSVDVAKDPNYNFKYFSFVSGKVVAGQPAKNDWDFVWGNSIYQNEIKGKMGPVGSSDMVFINVLAGAQAAEVLNADFTYDKITKADLTDSKIKFSSKGDAIGNKWRNLMIDGKGINTDRFYLIKDPSGNVYKLKFVKMGEHKDGGVRGRPVIEYKLIK